MIILLLLLSIYSSVLSTFLFGRWVRLYLLRRAVRKQITENNLSLEKEIFLTTHPPSPIEDAKKDIKEVEEEGEAIRAFELELEQEEFEITEDSVEEREYQEEQRALNKYRR